VYADEGRSGLNEEELDVPACGNQNVDIDVLSAVMRKGAVIGASACHHNQRDIFCLDLACMQSAATSSRFTSLKPM